MGSILRNVFGSNGGDMNALGITIEVIFFILLLAIIVLTLMRKKSYDDYHARMPLDDDRNTETKNID
jgi:cbb3-type cytochrome oxidase subunit 3